VIEPPTPPMSERTYVPLPFGMLGISSPCAADSGSWKVSAAQIKMLNPITPTNSFISFSKFA
jgi:hypothetical protein